MPAAGAAARPTSGAYKGAVLSLLLLAYTFNFIDRTIIGTIGQAIKVDLKISDAQLGLLGGLYFALLYTFLGIPIARLAERANRSWIITVSLVVWSGFTALCGLAQNFGQLALLRFGVGVGEAGLSPPAHSLISDYYEPRKRSSALAVYSFGIPLGTMFGAIVGGWLAQDFSWRVAFMVVGLPGIILAVIFKLVVREPKRGAADVGLPTELLAMDPAAPAPARGLDHEFSELWSVTKTLFAKWPVFHMVMGITVASFASYGTNAFLPPYLVREFGLGLKQVGLITGVIAGVSAGLGTIVGGFLTDFLGKKNARWYALVPAIGILIAAPLYVLGYNQPTWQMTALVLLLPGAFHYTYLAPTFAVVQNSVEIRRRATATAILFFFLNLFALGFGPPICGLIIDRLAAWNFAHPGVHALFDSAGHAFGGAAGGDFARACPGGSAPKGADVAAKAACKAVLARSTQQGITLQALTYFWASGHYFLAAIGMAKHIGRKVEAKA